MYMREASLLAYKNIRLQTINLRLLSNLPVPNSSDSLFCRGSNRSYFNPWCDISLSYRSLSSKMFGNHDGMHPLFNFLQTLQFKGRPLMINKRIESSQQLEDALSLAVEYLSSIADEVSPRSLL